MVRILSYGCTSAAGVGVDAYWQALQNPPMLPPPTPTAGWPVPIATPPPVFHWPHARYEFGQPNNARDLLVGQLCLAWNETKALLPKPLLGLGDQQAVAREDFRGLGDRRLGVILASTKGAIEDVVWGADGGGLAADTLQPVLTEFLRQAGISPAKSLCVSNACSSALVALYVAKRWLTVSREVDVVLVLAADHIGPFITAGFQSLRALASHSVRPFSADRDGLVLGEAAAAILLSHDDTLPALAYLTDVQTDSEGHAVTRPSAQGQSLRAACLRLKGLQDFAPQLCIAHGTGTPTNDRTEDQVLADLDFNTLQVTATKWCIGHTMATSGAMDVIAAAEVLRHQQAFNIATTTAAAAEFRSTYRVRGTTAAAAPLTSVLVTSLGFGGVHGAALISNQQPPPELAAASSLPRGVNLYQAEFIFPLASEPLWSQKVDRWYQLDAAAQALPWAFAQWQTTLGQPSHIILASATASNETDRHFAQSGATSPAKFVHTLPNIRCSSLLQLLDWQGPVVCVQAGNRTLCAALAEAPSFFAADASEKVWLISVTPAPTPSVSGPPRRYQVLLLEVSAAAAATAPFRLEKSTEPANLPCLLAKNDVDLSGWLNHQNGFSGNSFALGRWLLSRM